MRGPEVGIKGRRRGRKTQRALQDMRKRRKTLAEDTVGADTNCDGNYDAKSG